MDAPTLPLTTKAILNEIPRFRILLVGKSGVGKSSLINHAFNVNIAAISHQEPGKSDIEVGITSPDNERFVLHDSQGFERNETKNLEVVKDFIESRFKREKIADRLHAIWLCIEIPFAGARLFETGDEELLKFATSKQVPIIVAFTKFDQLVFSFMSKMKVEEMQKFDSHKALMEHLTPTADAKFMELCVLPLKKMDDKLAYAKTSTHESYQLTLVNLIDLTQGLVQNGVDGDVWLVSSMAQRVSALAKINSSIEIGMKKYWQGLASSTHFAGVTFEKCLATIHRDIILSWNFNDPNNLLIGEGFQNNIKELTQLVTPDPTDWDLWFKNVINVQTLVGAVAVPPIGVIGLSAMFIKWAADIYQQTPEVLRCLMGYIVNLTLVLDELFLSAVYTEELPQFLTHDQVNVALKEYTATKADKVRREIREYVDHVSFMKVMKSMAAQEKIKELVWNHRKVTA